MPTHKKKAKKRHRTLNAGRARRAKLTCTFAPFKLAKQDAFTMADLKKDKSKIVIKEVFVIGLLGDFGYTEGHELYAKLKKKVSARKFDIDFVGDFYDPPGDNMMWELSCMYNNIVKIKQFLLERQIQSLLASLRRGNIEVDDI